MKLITLGDFIDVYSKIKQRGSSFILSKLTVNKNKRSISAFNKSNKETSNFWIIPYFNKRINTLVSGDSNVNFETFLVNKHLKDRINLKLLSIGSGKCIHEIRLSKYHQFEKVVCLDINQENLDYAKRICKEENINNIEFICLDIKQFEFKENYFDIVLFSSSLHHFENVEELIKTKIKPTIKTKGLLVIYEFVGSKRLQFPKYQMKAINDALKLIPKQYRKRYKTNLYKNKYYGLGLLRMIIADPSECIDSENIIPSIHKHFKTLDEKSLGGNILINVLREISHHFVEIDDDKKQILDALFEFEDTYLKYNKSDLVFGVYQKA